MAYSLSIGICFYFSWVNTGMEWPGNTVGVYLTLSKLSKCFPR